METFFISLIPRVKLACEKHGSFFLKYIFHDSYSRVVRNNFTIEIFIISMILQRDMPNKTDSVW